MKVLKAYVGAFRSLTKYRYLILFLFSANFVISSILVAPFASYFKSKFANSTALEKYDGYDLYAIGEFLNNYGEGFQPLSIVVVIFTFSYFIFAVFANAGVLYAVISNNKIISLRPVATGAVNYFWKILRLSIYYLLAIALILLLVWKALLVAGINVLDVKDDLEIIRKVKWGIAFATILFALCSMMKQYAKVFIAIDKKPLISASILKSSKFVFRHIVYTIPLYLLNIGFLGLVTLLYYLLRNSINIDAWLWTFLVAQLLLILKIIIRILHLDSSYKLYASISEQKEKP